MSFGESELWDADYNMSQVQRQDFEDSSRFCGNFVIAVSWKSKGTETGCGQNNLREWQSQRHNNMAANRRDATVSLKCCLMLSLWRWLFQCLCKTDNKRLKMGCLLFTETSKRTINLDLLELDSDTNLTFSTVEGLHVFQPAGVFYFTNLNSMTYNDWRVALLLH